MPKPKTEPTGEIRVGQPVFCIKNKSKFIGICHAIDSRIEGDVIVEEAKVLVVAGQDPGEQFMRPLQWSEPHIFEMAEVFPILVDIGGAN